MKTALIHDHLAQAGGAEKVLGVLADMYPAAPIYTLLYETENVKKNFPGREIKTSIIQRLPWGVSHYRWYLIFMPMAVEFFDLRDFDVVISDVSAFAKGVITGPHTPHICYCHTPTRYLWSDTHEYINDLPYNKYFKKVIAMSLSWIRVWDKAAADRVDFFIANSKSVQQRIRKYYRRDSVVIYPPVETDRFKIAEKVGDYFLAGGRMVPYKRFDIIIEAFKLMPDKKLRIFGGGVDEARLKQLAGDAPNIEFVGLVSDEEKIGYFEQALAFINPQEEDFGITMVESMAAGRPVIAFGKSGALEIVTEGETGVLFYVQDAEAIKKAVENFHVADFDSAKIREYSEQFSVEKFQAVMQQFVEDSIKKFKNGEF